MRDISKNVQMQCSMGTMTGHNFNEVIQCQEVHINIIPEIEGTFSQYQNMPYSTQTLK